MALSYCVPFQCDSELNLNRSLHTALQNSSCASLKKIEEVVENGHFHFLPFERNKLQWVDEKKEVISICFPAILDLDGQFTMQSSDNHETSSSTFTSYRNMSASEIMTEIKQYESSGLHYLGHDNIVDLCTFTYQKDLKGEILVPKNNTNNISELLFAGVYEIDARNFFMTSDGKWNSNNPLSTRFDQVKPSCRLLPVQKDEFSLFEKDYSTIIANIRAIKTLGNPRKSRDCHSIIIDEPGQPSQIKLYHHLFSVRHLHPFKFFSNITNETLQKEKKTSTESDNNGTGSISLKTSILMNCRI